MIRQQILLNLIHEFNQEGAVTWFLKEGVLRKLESHSSEGPPFQDVSSFVASGDTFRKVGRFSLIRSNHLILAFEGKWTLSEQDVNRFVSHFGDWLLLFAEHSEKIRRERSLSLLIDTAQTIVSSVQEDNVLDIMIQSAISAIPLADAGFLFLYDKQMDKLIVKSAVGFYEEKYRLTKLSPKEAISGTVFDSGVPVIINGEENIKEAMTNMTADNRRYYLDSTMYADYPHSVVCVPMHDEQERIGVLTINNFTKEAYFTDDDQKDLLALANHIAIAITQAKLFETERKQREELMMIHEALHKEHQRLQKSTDLHNTLTNLAAKGKGISAILNGLHRIANVPVAVYDSLLARIAVSPDATKYSLPDDFFLQQPVKLMLENKKWQVLKRENDVLILIPILGFNQLFGFLCAWIHPDVKYDNHVFLLEYGATVLALEWTKQEAVRITEEQIRGEVIDQLLTGDMTQSLNQRARQLGLDPHDWFTVILIRSETEHDSDYFDRRRRIRDIQQVMEYRDLKGIALYYDAFVMMIAAFDQTQSRPEADEIRTVANYMNSGLTKAYLTTGRPYQGLENLHRSYREAEKCMELLNRHMLEAHVLHYHDIGAYRFFLQQDKEELERYVEDTLGPLIRYDKRKKSSLMETLLLYVQYERNLKELAVDLDIHYNTLYYRLNRMQEILGVTFDHSENWFNIQLACRIFQYLYQLSGETDLPIQT